MALLDNLKYYEVSLIVRVWAEDEDTAEEAAYDHLRIDHADTAIVQEVE